MTKDLFANCFDMLLSELYKIKVNKVTFVGFNGIQWRAEGGGECGAGPGHPSQGGIQRVKLQKFKCC